MGNTVSMESVPKCVVLWVCSASSLNIHNTTKFLQIFVYENIKKKLSYILFVSKIITRIFIVEHRKDYEVSLNTNYFRRTPVAIKV